MPDIGSSTILRYLDRGIMDILGPHIATEETAANSCGRATSVLWASGHSVQTGVLTTTPGFADKASYYAEANQQLLVFALLENVAVLDNLDAILSVPGIDLYSIGPNPGQPDHPKLSRQGRAGRSPG